MDEDNDESGTDNQLTEETNKRNHSQVGEDKLQTNTIQPTTRKLKMNVSVSTSQVVAEAEISLSASDVKDKYMDASLPLKWKAFETVIFLERVISTNESNIDRWKKKRQAAVDSKIGRLNSFIKRVEVPIQVFVACGVASSGGK
ncbi:unnamed protein product [Eruca vesicaria subsp. sativa]|uniref:Uncharacterized protein n=1 Tax=Eruca vesicaria subsp. sativa TaxID=29727 RepID=A0ABC8LF73_ERUVS|nr:unnamed protein product [Eruca vesicaria subsp. sativa]